MPLRGLLYFAQFSDAFISKDVTGDYQWTAHVININENLTLQKKCKPLYDYIQFTSRIKENKDKGMANEKAIDEASRWGANIKNDKAILKKARSAKYARQILTRQTRRSHKVVLLRLPTP